MRNIWYGVFFLLAAVGCNDPASKQHGGPAEGAFDFPRTHEDGQPVNVVATTGMVADLVRNVGGDRVKVTQLFGAGVDPHLYKATSRDTGLLSKADLIVYSGHHLEGKMTELFEHLARKVPTVSVTDRLPVAELLRDEHGVVDPHVWFDVSLWSRGADVVRDALIEYNPSHADAYRNRAKAFRAKLDALDAETTTRMKAIDEKQRVLVTSHDAFRYFGRRYGIEVKGIQGITTEAEASVRDLQDLAAFLASRKIPAVFVESSVNPRNIEALREGCKANGHDVAVGGELFSDAMGAEGTPEGTYEGMIRKNVDTIANALSGRKGDR
ncbi:MAG: zinc ABC transporter substrate-binding protein [Gemmataceae bacterium]|nr:zinc ABC transporter substrate-binding protein [Gemmataceae bacterium]